MKVTCHSCGAKYGIADDKVRGRRVKVRCKSCNTPIVVDGIALESEMAGAPPPGDDDEATRSLAKPPPVEEWSVNLSDTDQRTMTTHEIIDGWHSGLVTEDAFVWRDGMNDWKPLLEVPEFAARLQEPRASNQGPARAASNGSRPAAAAGGFGFGVGAGAGVVASAGASAGAAARVKGRGAGSDLFGRAAQAGGEEEAHAAAPGTTPYAEQRPTGARNENSVLFSLDALKAGINPTAPQPSAPRKAAGVESAALDDLMNLGGPSQNPLFGLGANQALLNAPPPPPEPVPAPPVDLAASYAPPVPQRSNKLIFALGGAVALLLVVVAVLLLGKGSDDKIAKNEATAEKGESETKSSSESKKGESESKKTESSDPSSPGEANKEGENAQTDEKKDTKPVSEEDKKRYAEAMAKKKEEAAKTGEPEKPAEAPKPPSSGVSTFNKSAAISALSSAAAAASGCKRPDGPTGTGKAIVTFAPSGNVTSANVTGGSFGGTSVGGCIASVFRRAKVPPFEGDAVTVSKSFTIAD
jgi:predicted Zn finger-like uncharacterized protein